MRAPLCHDCHELAHDDLRLTGLDLVDPGTVLETVELGLRRMAVFLARLDRGPLAGLARTLASWCQANAERLAGAIAALDLLDRSWRIAPGNGDA